MRPPTRRELVQHAIAATFAGATGPALLAPEAALGAAESDEEVIHRLLATELLIAYVYQHVLRLQLLTQPSARIAEEFAGHEHAHIAALAEELRRLGVAAPPAPASVAAAEAALAAGHVKGSLVTLRTAQDCLKLLNGLESLAEGSYFKAIGMLRNPGLVHTAAQIMACEAQHWTVLAELQYPGKIYRSVPWPYVTGTS